MRRTSLVLAVLALAVLACSKGETTSAIAPVDTGTAVNDAAPRAVRIYMAGESIERRNHYVEAPFRANGALNDRGGGELRNDNEEYGWMVPLADRLVLRNPALSVVWVGADAWLDADDAPYSGTYPSTTPRPSSAISGTTIDAWLESRRSELTAKTHCYDLAIASRGGNDFTIEDDAAIKASLKELLSLLAAGSSCNENPPIYVTAHMPDDQRTGPEPDNKTYVAQQKQRFITRFRDATNELQAKRPTLRLRFVDLYTPFLDSKKTTAFPSETWSTGGVPDYVKIGRLGDLLHIRRLSSIYCGELFADAVELADVR